MNTYTWYSQLVKPVWAPPSWIFGPVWTVLYAIIAVSFGVVLYRALMGRLAWAGRVAVCAQPRF
jgi:benzodiazapine receptor